MIEILETWFTETLKDFVGEKSAFHFEFPGDLAHGDFSCNIALILGKKLGRKPLDLAHEFRDMLLQTKPEEVEKIEVASPGFINIYFSKKYFTDAIGRINERFGENEELKGKRVIVEYTQPNPFKPFHIGHLMSNTIGESISRIVERSGAEIRRANYQGDVGLHVAKALWGIQKKQSDAGDVEALGEAYVYGNTAYEESEEAKKEIDALNIALYKKKDPELLGLYEAGRTASLQHFEEIYKILGTKFDFYFFESESTPVGERLVDEGLAKHVFEESDGAIVFRGEKYGLHTRVFRTSLGLSPYEAKDLGLMKLKEEKWQSDQSIIVTASEQKEYFKVVTEAMRYLIPDLAEKTKHISHGMMRLESGKMSSRKGNIITGESLLDDIRERAFQIAKDNSNIPEQEKRGVAETVGIAAIKYSILKQATGKDIVFDFDASLSFEGNSGPYLQYTYARAQSVLKKAEEAGINTGAAQPKEIGETERLLVRFPEIVKRALREYEPHYIATFLYELASAFNHFYAKEKIISDEPESAYRVALTKAVAQTLKNGLWLLGIASPERM